jgi:hypothetical protein
LQNVSTTIATLIAFPVRVIELGTILQVMLSTGLEQVSCTVPVVPGKAVSTSPNTALLPGVVVTVEEPCPIPIVTGLLPLLKVAATIVAAVIVTTHVPVPVQPPPLQPAKVELADAAAVNVTCVPLAKFAEQVVGQLIPDGALTTVPAPGPASVTVNPKFGLTLKLAVTDVAAVIVNVQLPVPWQTSPPHPANTEPGLGIAVNVIWLFPAKTAEQAVGQLIPAGELVTVPAPVTVMESAAPPVPERLIVCILPDAGTSSVTVIVPV